ncbi:MAG: RNA polymerase sigma factor [Kiloniellales bacterium]
MADGFDELDRLLLGDAGAWGRFVTRFAPVIYAAIHRRLGPAGRTGEAEDVAQDVFVRICARDFRLLRTYEPARAKLSTWLTVIASSAAIDHLRRRKAATQPLDDLPEALLAVQPEVREHFNIPPGVLSARQALIVELLYQRDLDPAEVGRLLGIEPQSVRSLHHKALTRLRAHFSVAGEGDDARAERVVQDEE